MSKAVYDRSPVIEGAYADDSGNPAPLNNCNGSDNGGNRGTIPGLETEWAICAARLEKKSELDARFAEIIELIQETRQMIEQTIVDEFEVPVNRGQSIQ